MMAFSSQSGGGPVYKNKVNGDFASYYAFSRDEASSTGMYLEVFPGNASTWLYFSVDRCTAGSDREEYVCESTSGYGPIPSSDFKGSFQQGFSLTTDTRSNPDFRLWSGESGMISVEWSRTGWFESRRSGSSELRWMNTVVRENGTRREASAAVTGTILGFTVPEDGWGTIASANNLFMEFERRGGR